MRLVLGARRLEPVTLIGPLLIVLAQALDLTLLLVLWKEINYLFTKTPPNQAPPARPSHDRESTCDWWRWMPSSTFPHWRCTPPVAGSDSNIAANQSAHGARNGRSVDFVIQLLLSIYAHTPKARQFFRKNKSIARTWEPIELKTWIKIFK